MILLIISFLAGILTILAPCTLPLLPIIIGSSVAEGGESKHNLRKAFVIAVSLGASVVLFTLILKATTFLVDIPAGIWSLISGIIILIFGLISLFPTIWEGIPFVGRLNRGSNKLLAVGYQKQSFTGDIIIGASLGPVFSTCSPTYFVILATVLPQAFFLGFIYLLAYAVGLAGVLLLIAYLGQKIVGKLGGVSDTHGWFKKTLGALFVIIGLLVIFGVDKKLETKLLKSGLGDITKIEQKLLQFNEKLKSGAEKIDNAGSGLTGTLFGGRDLKPAPEIVKPSGFVNTDGKPITIEEFKGKKVILLDIWTYSCINCQRTIPYLKAWDEKYRDQGLLIIGLHTPEFAFEHKLANVERAVKEYGIKYPVVLDNDFATWNAYGNNYWPRKYLINVDGNIVYDHIGEGDYDETEKEIQKALMELKMKNGEAAIIPTDIEKPADAMSAGSGKVKSPEIYFGAQRNEYLGNGTPGKTGVQKFTLPFTLPTEAAKIKGNVVYMDGTWDLNAESAVSKTPAKIVFKYNAKMVYMVMSSQLPEGTVITIKKDGKVEKTITVTTDSLYTLIEGEDYGEHLLEIEIPSAGLDVYTFTFG